MSRVGEHADVRQRIGVQGDDVGAGMTAVALVTVAPGVGGAIPAGPA